MSAFRLSRFCAYILGMVMIMGVMQVPLYGKVSEDLYPVEVKTVQGDRYGYINDEGKWIIKPVYEQAYPFSGGTGIVVKNDLFGLINNQGKKVVKPKYQSISPFKEERAVVVDQKGMGVIDTKGKEITKTHYEYVGDYEEGVAVVGVTQPDGSILYGYIDQEGDELITPHYLEANPFTDGKALVKDKDEKYIIIDKGEQVLSRINAPFVYGYSEGKVIFSKELGGQVGYMDEEGKVIIPPQFNSAQPFKEGTAIVSTSQYLRGENGLINEKGEYIYNNQYDGILALGENRVALGKPINPAEPVNGSIYAIADLEGNRLTDFIYYGVSEYQEGLASVYDQKNTYFVNLKGQKVSDLPIVTGAGTLSKEGNIVAADIDYRQMYLTLNGEKIYAAKDTLPLGKCYSVAEEKYKPNLNYLVYEPQIKGVKDQAAETRINQQLKQLSRGENGEESNAAGYTYYSDYELKFYGKDLLIPQIVSSTYYFGAAHPLPTMKTPAIDLVTGTFYQLEDLFKQDTDWQMALEVILQEMIRKDEKYKELFPDAQVTIEENQSFYVDDDALYLYYSPYDIAPYSAGFVTFRIPYTQIYSLINQKGSFWNAYH